MNNNNKQQKANLLNSIVAGNINPKSLVNRPFAKYVSFGEGINGIRYTDTLELVPDEVIKMASLLHGSTVKRVSFFDDEELTEKIKKT